MKTVQMSNRNMSSSSMTLPLVLSIIMALIIAGTIFVGKGIAIASIPLFIIAIIGYAFHDRVSAICVLISYAAMEGMFKYLTGFSQAVYAVKPFLLLLLLIIWGLNVKRSGRPPGKLPLIPWIVALAAWGLVEAINPLGGGLASSVLALWVWYLAPVVLYILVSDTVKNVDQINKICLSLVAVSVVVSGFAVVQYTMGHSWTTAHLPGYDKIRDAVWFVQNTKGHVTSSSWEPASTGATSGGGAFWAYVGIVTMLGIVLSSATTYTQKVVLALCFIVNIAGLLVSGVRLYVTTGIVVSLLLLVLLSTTRRQLLRSCGVASLALIFISVGFNIAQSSSNGVIASRYADTLAHPVAKAQHDRGGNMTYLLPLLTQYPFGFGFQRGTEVGQYSAGGTGLSMNRETQFNSMSNDCGLPGLIILVALLILTVRKSFRTFKTTKTPYLRAIAALMFVLLIGFTMQCFGGPALQSSDCFWIFAGLTAALPAIQRATLLEAQ